MEIINRLFELLQHLGYWGVFFGLLLEVIPSEIVLAYGGYLVSQDSQKAVGFVFAVVLGVVGGTIAQVFVYWIGRYGGRPFLEKYGKYLLINKHHIEVSERWFEKYGTGVIFSARFIPVVRHAISIPAGITRMPLGKFVLLTTLAVIPWSILFVYLGYQMGDNWEHIHERAGHFTIPFLIAALGIIVVYVGYKWSRKNKSGR